MHLISLWWVIPLGVAALLTLTSIRLPRDDADAPRFAGWMAGFLVVGWFVPTDSGAFYPFVAASFIAFCFAGYLVWRYDRATRK